MPAYKDGQTWRYRKRVELPDGTRVRVTGTPQTSNTKTAAEKAEREHVRSVLYPTSTEDTPKEVPTLREYSERWLLHYKKGKPSDMDAKNQMLNAYIYEPLGDVPLDCITQEHVDRLICTLLDGRRRKTINNILAVVSSLVKHAVRARIIPDPQLVCHLETDDDELIAVEMDDVNKLLEIADERYTVAILLACEAGLRIGEIRGLERGDVNELRRRLSIDRSKDVKNRTTPPKHWKGRKVPISERLWNALETLPVKSGPLFLAKKGTPLSYWGARDGIVGLYDKAGVDVPPQPWHSLRHTFGTQLAEANVPVPTIKQLMGHRSIATTLRYVHVGDDQQANAIDAAFGGESHLGNHWAKRPARKEESPASIEDYRAI